MRKIKIRLIKLSRAIIAHLINIRSGRAGDEKTINVEELAIAGKSCFFGYHDLEPCFDDGDKVLTHVYPGKANDPEAIKNEIDLGYFEKNDGQWKFNKIGSSSAWCWQQGARLQHFSQNGKSLIVYNIRKDSVSFGSVVFDLERNKMVKEKDFPINVLSQQGNLAGTLNFGLLGVKRPGYGYYVKEVDPIPYVKVFRFEDDREVYKKEFGEDIEYINHIDFSPDERFLTYFKFYKSRTKSRLRSLCVVDLLNGRQVSEFKDLNFSHFVWLSNTELLLSVSTKLFWKAIKLDIESGKMITMNYWIGDFHPCLVKEREKIIFDSYPLDGRRGLYITDLKFKRISKFFDLKDDQALYGEYRVDLHPRFCSEKNSVHVDAGENSFRKSLLIGISV